MQSCIRFIIKNLKWHNFNVCAYLQKIYVFTLSTKLKLKFNRIFLWLHFFTWVTCAFWFQCTSYSVLHQCGSTQISLLWEMAFCIPPYVFPCIAVIFKANCCLIFLIFPHFQLHLLVTVLAKSGPCFLHKMCVWHTQTRKSPLSKV